MPVPTIQAQVAQLAAEGHQEIKVITLPSQAAKKSRKPRARRAYVSKAVEPTIYTEAPARNFSSVSRAFMKKQATERRLAAIERRMEREGLS